MIEQLHQTYVAVTGFVDVRLVPPFDRWLFDLMKAGFTPPDLKLLLLNRKRALAKGMRKSERCLFLSVICRDEEAVAEAVEELNAIKARLRKHCYTPAKAAVLRATGRFDEPQPSMAKNVAEVLRKVLDSV